MIHAVVNVVARLAVAHRLADDPGDGGRGGGDEESPGLGENLDVPVEQAVNLGIDDARQFAKRFDVLVVGGGKAPAHVENLDLAAALAALLHDGGGGGGVERLDKILGVRALAADVETQALDDEPELERFEDQIHRLAGLAAELVREFAL